MANLYLLAYLLIVGLPIIGAVIRGFYEYGIDEGKRVSYYRAYEEGVAKGTRVTQQINQRIIAQNGSYDLDIREAFSTVAVSKRLEQPVYTEIRERMIKEGLSRAITIFLLKEELITIEKYEEDRFPPQSDTSYYVGRMHVGKRIPRKEGG